MIHELKYVNLRGDEVIFGGEKGPWHFGKTDIFDIEQDYDEVGGVIVDFDNGIKELSLLVVMSNGSLAERNRFIDVVSYDTRLKKPGTLYAGGSYLKCWFKDVPSAGWHVSDTHSRHNSTLVSDRPYWIRTHSETLTKIDIESGGGLNYPHDYPHDYGYSAGTSRIVENPFMLPASVNLTFPGPCSDPYVIIGGNRYQVKGSAKKGQLIIVRGYPLQGSKKEIVLKDADGTEHSILSDGVREKGAQIFAQVPVGKSTAAWSGGYNVAIEMFEERLAPWWT